MTTYATLNGAKTVEGSIKYAVNHSTVPSASIITNAEAFIYSRLRVREMKALATGTLTSGTSTLTLPTDFREAIWLGLGGDYARNIPILDEDHSERITGYTTAGALNSGPPSYCRIDDTIATFDTVFDQNYTYRLHYFKTPTALVTASSNFLSTRYEHVLEAICKYFAYMHRENMPYADRWLQIGLAGIEQANAENDMHLQATRTEIHWGANQ